MEVSEAIRRRRMVRSFAAKPLERGLVEELLADALRSPTAGNARGVSWIVLEGDETALYWRHATTAGWRGRSTRFPGLSRAPVVALCLCSPGAYLERYGEADKAGSGLGPAGPGGGGHEAWPVPYWFGDAAFSVMALLLGASGRGIGAAFLGNFRGETELLDALGVPGGWRLFGTVLLGHPDGADRRSRSLDRAPAPGAGVVHRSRWSP